MLRKLFRRKEKDSGGAVALAMVVLKNAAAADAGRLAAAVSSLGVGTVEVDPGEGVSVSVRIGGGLALLSLMPGPIPWSDLGPACEASWMWPGAAAALKPCTAHLVVVVSGIPDPVEANLVLTRLAAAAVKATRSPGVYWGSAGMVHEGWPFLEEAESASREDLPVMLWVRVNLSVKGGRCDGSTTGLEAFGQREFEVHASRRTPPEVGEILTLAASYVLDQGPVLKDGQTFGRSAAEKIAVRHGPSKWEEGRRVIVLGY